MLNTSRNYPTTSAYPIACKYIGESIRHHCVCNVLIWHIRHKDLQTINNSGYYVNFTVIDEPILTQCIIMIISGCGSMVLTHREDGRYLNKDGQASEGLPISSGCRYSNHRKDFYSNTEFTVDEGRHMFISLRRIWDDTISRDLVSLWSLDRADIAEKARLDLL